ncbi:hypothetical protein AB0M36_16910 [Actinoplanes sp. NPDC051346]|uniref:hypothetical protein n=1 Tax=Actinoplanes sp. NPDC051346 TaxID=3155048 RepID=UPI003435FEAE
MAQRPNPLCADSRIWVDPDGILLHTGDKKSVAEPEPPAAAKRPRMPRITPLTYEPGPLAGPLTEGFLERQPPVALDLMGHVPLPSQDAPLGAFALGAAADHLGIFVQVPKADLAPTHPGPALPLAEHRLVPLDRSGQITTLHQASAVRVVPRSSRAAGAYGDVSAEVATLFLKQPYLLSGRIVFGPDGVELGLPAGLVNQWHGGALTGFGRPLDNEDLQGAGPPVALAGYVDLLHRMESSPPNSQGLVTVDRGAGQPPQVFLAHRGDYGVSFLDPGSGKAAIFPEDPVQVRFSPLPDAMPLEVRLDQLTNTRVGAKPEPSWQIRLPADTQFYKPAGSGSDLPIVVVGRIDDEPSSVMDPLVASVSKLGQPIVVLGADRSGAPPNAERVAKLGSLLEQYGWRGKVPLVVTRARLNPKDPATIALHGVLDKYQAPLVHRAPAGAGAQSTGGGLSLRLDNPWTVREALTPDGTTQPGVKPPFAGNLTLQLLQFAAGKDRRPAHGAPTADVAHFLTTPLIKLGSGSTFGGEAVKALRPQVEQIVHRDPSFAGHNAALHLAAAGKADFVTSYLNNKDARLETIFQPLLTVGGETPASNQQAIQTLLPHLAALAGANGVQDYAGHGILGALNGLLTGTKDMDKIRDEIHHYKDYLPKEGRVHWIRQLGALKAQLPEEQASGIDQVGEAIMTCPE